MTQRIEVWLARALRAQREGHTLLAGIEGSRSRIITLADARRKLTAAPADVQDYFEEALGCLEYGFHRSGIVLAWAGFFSIFAERLYTQKLTEVLVARPKWSIPMSSDMKDCSPEAQIVDVAREVKFIGKAEHRILDGHLATRNQCAHPTVFKPSQNVALGFADEMISRVLKLI